LNYSIKIRFHNWTITKKTWFFAISRNAQRKIIENKTSNETRNTIKHAKKNYGKWSDKKLDK